MLRTRKGLKASESRTEVGKPFCKAWGDKGSLQGLSKNFRKIPINGKQCLREGVKVGVAAWNKKYLVLPQGGWEATADNIIPALKAGREE